MDRRKSEGVLVRSYLNDLGTEDWTELSVSLASVDSEE